MVCNCCEKNWRSAHTIMHQWMLHSACIFDDYNLQSFFDEGNPQLGVLTIRCYHNHFVRNWFPSSVLPLSPATHSIFNHRRRNAKLMDQIHFSFFVGPYFWALSQLPPGLHGRASRSRPSCASPERARWEGKWPGLFREFWHHGWSCLNMGYSQKKPINQWSYFFDALIFFCKPATPLEKVRQSSCIIGMPMSRQHSSPAMCRPIGT